MVSCRNCGSVAVEKFLDLGSAPLSNGYLTDELLGEPESWIPLSVGVCKTCWLAQTLVDLDRSQIFTPEYAYFSSTSNSWLEHARKFAKTIVAELGLGRSSLVIEVASNDGYLLRQFDDQGIPCVGVEPTASTAAAARKLGLRVVEDFLGNETGRQITDQFGKADLVIANNVLAHVPDLKDFIAGILLLMKSSGVVSFEFPRLTALIDGRQFDTVYHEHYSYLSLHSVKSILSTHGLQIFDVHELETHGGSLRVFAQIEISGQREVSQSVARILDFERACGLCELAYYEKLQAQAEAIKNDLSTFLTGASRAGQTVVGYGAAAKGNTLFNFAGIRPDLCEFVVDRSPFKVGNFLPGSRIPIVQESVLRQHRPDFVIILPWNIRQEVIQQLDYIRGWGGRFVTAVPHLEFH